MFDGMHVTVTGYSHEKKGIVCQDSSSVLVRDSFAIAVVADGHGSRKHFRSDVGSRIAVKVTEGLLEKYMNRPGFPEQFLKNPSFLLGQMEKHILLKWREAVAEYHSENPLTGQELESFSDIDVQKLPVPVIYGSTLLAAVLAESFSFALVLGDGGFVALDGQDRLSIPVEDPNARANYTSSLCNTEAVRFFESWFSPKPVKALFVSTDGLYKSFASEEDFLRYHGLLARMLADPERAKSSMERNFLKRTRQGSGDDISMSLVYRREIEQ